jgi:hypothetical protein
MKILEHRFVEFIPEEIEEGILYISIEYKTAVHQCVCGCGNKVITPITPNDWRVTFDGKTVSLYPSIGNWGFECKSHYWITNNKIQHAPRWSFKEIEAGREEEKSEKKKFFRMRKKGKKNKKDRKDN